MASTQQPGNGEVPLPSAAELEAFARAQAASGPARPPELVLPSAAEMEAFSRQAEQDVPQLPDHLPTPVTLAWDDWEVLDGWVQLRCPCAAGCKVEGCTHLVASRIADPKKPDAEPPYAACKCGRSATYLLAVAQYNGTATQLLGPLMAVDELEQGAQRAGAPR